MRQPSYSQIQDFLSKYKNLDKVNEKAISNNETVSTAMTLQRQVLKPFLGQLKNKKHSFKPNTKILKSNGSYYYSPVYIPNPHEPPYTSSDSYEIYEQDMYL